jgi:hypothetical protein
VVIAGRTTWFLGTVVTTGRHGPGDGNGGREGGSVVPTAKEEWDSMVPRRDGQGRTDGAVPGCGNDMQAVGVAAAWPRRRRRGCGKFW